MFDIDKEIAVDTLRVYCAMHNVAMSETIECYEKMLNELEVVLSIWCGSLLVRLTKSNSEEV